MLPLRGKILNVEKSRIDKVLQNVEIQALITALGTGVRDEFSLENARYHKVILMTDADVDGAHIRTLVLTLLFREMPELIEAGYVYIAKPPLYKLKQGRSERYVERESELEQMLLADKLESVEVTDRTGQALKLTETRWQRFSRLLKQYEGWSSHAEGRVRARPGRVPGGEHGARRGGRDPRGGGRAAQPPGHRGRALRDEARRGDAHPSRRARRGDALRPRPHPPPAPRPLRGQRVPPARRASIASCVELAGTPPFQVRLKDDVDQALSFEMLRAAVLDACRKGVNVQRFKGLGEMNADQLADTTMNPASRDARAA